MTNSNGYFQLLNQPDGTYLRLYSPKGEGKAVTFNELSEYLSENNIFDYDIKAVRRVFSDTSIYQQEVRLTLDKLPPINETLKINVSDDRLLVTGRFYAPSTNGSLLTKEEILQIISQDIKYGIIEENINSFLNKRRYCEDFVLAKGRELVKGRDAVIKYHFNTDKSRKPKLNKDGTVDFHQLNILNSVQENDVLATLTPAYMGESGIDVYGNELRPQKVKSLVLKHGKNIYLSEDKQTMYSGISGHVRLEGNKVCVSDSFVVRTNVDASTGNIDHEGNVSVEGHVLTGFSIRAKGDIIINGVVEGASLEAGGNIILKHGMQGMGRGIMKAGGNIVSKFIENTEVYADGHITTEAILHSKIIAKNDIVVQGGKGSISGGEVHSGTNIISKNVGSSMGTYTLLEINKDYNLFEQCQSLNRKIKKRQNEIDKLTPVIKKFNKKLVAGEKIPGEKMEYLKIATNKCISLYSEMNELVKELRKLNNLRNKKNNGTIIIERKVYPGVKIIIGNASYYVNEALAYIKFIRENNEIKMINI